MKDIIKEWGAIFVELLLAFGVFTGIGAILHKSWHKMNSWRSRMAMLAVMGVYRIIKALYYVTRCERVLIVKSHNGHGIPKVNTTTSVTILYEECGESKPILQDWQNRPLQGDARTAIENLIEKKEYDVIVDNLPSGAYKGTFDQHKIKVAMHFEIRAARSGYYFLILWFTQSYLTNPSELKGKLQASISTALVKLRKVFK